MGTTMLRTTPACALAATAAAFAPSAVPALRSSATSMSMNMDRRQGVQSAAIAGVVPFLGSSAANAAPKMEADSYAPIVTVFDARGCPRGGSEYSGERAGDQDDDMAVKVASRKIPADLDYAATVRKETLAVLGAKI